MSGRRGMILAAVPVVVGVVVLGGCGKKPRLVDERTPEQRQRDQQAQRLMLQRRSAARSTHRSGTVH